MANRPPVNICPEDEGIMHPSGRYNIESYNEWKTVKDQLINKYIQRDRLASRLERMGVCLLEYATCTRCTEVMILPCTLLCGHVFCAQCLKQSFTMQLKNRLGFFQYKSDAEVRLSVPQTSEQQLELVKILKDHGAYFPSFFWYDCPHDGCRIKVQRAPTQSYQIKSSIDSVNLTIQKRPSTDSLADGAAFKGLFKDGGM